MEKVFEALDFLKQQAIAFEHSELAIKVANGNHTIVKQALIEKQDLERFTRLVIVKSFNFDRFRYVLRHWDTDEQLGVYNYGIGNVYKYTKEEFNFLKEMITKYGKSI